MLTAETFDQLELNSRSIQEKPMLRLTKPRHVSTSRPENKRRAYTMLIAIALSTTSASAYAGDHAVKTPRPTSGAGVPAWVLRECRPATPAELAAQWAGPGEWFYRTTWDFCYLDTRPGLHCPPFC
jgi:hypothetical protein